MNSIRDRLEEIGSRVARAAERSGRSPADVTVIAVSKTVSPEVVVEAFHLGQRDFGENRVQEFAIKRQVLDSAGILPRYHMIGHLQTNKAAVAARLFDIIESVDSVRLARLLNKEAEESGKILPVLLEVDFGDDPARPGLDPIGLDEAAGQIAELRYLDVQGLMTVAPRGLELAGVRAVFRALREARDRLAAEFPASHWQHLSMGMSNDFETAIEEGATMVRIGRAIFGARPPVA